MKSYGDDISTYLQKPASDINLIEYYSDKIVFIGQPQGPDIQAIFVFEDKSDEIFIVVQVPVLETQAFIDHLKDFKGGLPKAIQSPVTNININLDRFKFPTNNL